MSNEGPDRQSASACENGDILLVGGGQASYMAASALRRGGHVGTITIVGEEAYLPYERPPLSKAVLLGEAEAEGAFLTSAEALAAHDIRFVQGRIVTIDREHRRAAGSSGETFSFDYLVLATGGEAKRPLISGAPPISVLRTMDDALELRRRLCGATRLLVIGGGWIGLEVAASASKAGLAVDVVEAADRLCLRSLPEGPSRYLADLHAAHGVRVHLGRRPDSLEQREAGCRMVLDDGSVIDADFAVAGIGMTPRIDLARACGLAVDAGILVDSQCRTSDPAIFAAGDVAQICIDGRSTRVESWANANEQAAIVAAAILGHAAPDRQPPWFWSDQFNCNLQILGDPAACSSVVETSTGEYGARSWYYLDGDRLSGIVAANRPRDIQAGRRLMARDAVVTATALEEAGYDLALLLRKPVSREP